MTNASPLDPRKAAPAIMEAGDRKRIFELLLRATRTKARFAALLSVHTNEIRGQFAFGDAAFDTRGVSELRIPRNSVPNLEKAIASGQPSITSLETGEPFIDGYLDGVLGRPSSHLLLPIAIGDRTVAVVAAHRGDAAMRIEDVSDLEMLFAVTGEALARVLATRGRAATVTTAAPTVKPPRPETRDDGYEIEVSVPDVEGKRRMLAAYRANEEWRPLAQGIRELVRDGMETGEPGEDEQLELLLELGSVEADKLGRSDRAIEAWKSAQTIDAGDPRLIEALERVFVRQGQWEEYADLLDKKAVLADGAAARIHALLELGAIARERLGDDARAIGAYERILSVDSGHARASKELEVLYTEHARWEDLIALLLDRASRHDDPKERVDALMSVAHLYEVKVGDGRDAFLVWLTVFRREPERPHLIEQLARLADNASHLHEVVAETKTLADELAAAHPKVAAGLWQLLGAWQRDRMGNRDAAAQAFEQAARLDPAVISEAAEALRADERWTELAALLVRRVETETDPKKRAELCIELGELYEATLCQPGEAIRWFERARDHDRTTPAPLVALHRLMLDTQAWHALGELLPELIDALGNNAPRGVIVDLYVELGQVLGEHLNRPEEAIDAYREAIALDEKNVAAFKGLAQVYAATGQTEALLDATEDEVDAAGGANQVQRYGDIAAAWYELARRDRAIACWRKLLAVDPSNIGAHKGLARALRDEEQWAELVVAQKAQLKQTIEPFDRIALLLEMADLAERQFDNVEGAIAAYRDVLALDAHNGTALDALGRLYDRAGQWQPALDMLQRYLAELAPTDRKARAQLLARIGHVQLGARDPVKAETTFGEATALDPDNALAYEGMGRVLLAGGKLAAATEKLLRAAQLSPPDTVRLLTDAAWVFRYRSNDNEGARACLDRILEIDPANADAKQALAELLHDTQEWSTLWPHLEQEAARARADAAMPAAEKAAILAKAGRCALELGKHSTAIELYDLAIASDPSPATQLERAQALYRSKALEAAAAAYQTVATLHGKSMDRAQQILVYRWLGAIQAELGKAPQAIGFYQKVLDLDPSDPTTLDALVDLHLAGGRYDDAVASLRSRAALASPTDRIRLLERVGNLYRDKLQNPARAMSAYLDALAIDKTDHRVLQRVLDLQSETGQWKAAIETIDRFLELEDDRARRGAYLIASAEIHRTHLKDPAGALELYETALDEMLKENPLRDSTRERAFDAFNVLRELVAGDAKYLEQTYRRMIKRLPKDAPEHIPLWDALGDVYRLRLDHPQSAIEAFELAHTLDPEKSAHRARILADLYAKTGAKRPAQASERAAKLVEVDPTNAAPYHALRRTALAAGRTDEAWCVSRALVFLKQADKDEQTLYRRFQQLETRKAKGILDDDAWAYLRHPDEDLAISTIFSLTWEAAVALKAGPSKAFELKPKERLAIEESTGIVAKIFKHASRVLNVPLPDVYVQPRRPGRLLLANCIEKGRLVPAVIVGRDLMTGYRDTEIAASVGAMIALLRPAYYLKLTLGTVPELEAALHAAALAVGLKSRAARPELEQATNQIAAELQRRLTRSTGETLLSLVQRLPEKPDLVTWRNAVDAAAQRAALLVSGDLGATARMISSEAAASAQRPTQRVQELVAYSVSPAYFAARRHLQVTVD